MPSDSPAPPESAPHGQQAEQISKAHEAGPALPESSLKQSSGISEEKADPIELLSSAGDAFTQDAKDDATVVANSADPLDLGRHRRDTVSQKQMRVDYPLAKPKHMKKFYTRQNALIDQFLQSGDEERLAALDQIENGPKVRFAVNASFVVNFCLFVIQLYAAVSTGSLSLFATAADAFMDLVSSCVLLITSRMAARPSVYKYPVGRTRIETIGIIIFCCLMTTVAIQLIVESGRALGAGAKKTEGLQIIPIAFVAVAMNSFGLAMSIIGSRIVWFVDPLGAILIGLLILVSWAANAFDHIWLLVGKSAPQEFISKLIYLVLTHDARILKIDTCRAYHAGQKYYVEVDIIMDESMPLKTTHDVSQTLQRKLEGLADVERAYVHVDYEDEHDIKEEHKPLYEVTQKKTMKERVKSIQGVFKKQEKAA